MSLKTNKNYFLLIASICTVLLITVLRTIRLPNDWAEAFWLLNYDFGFVKRLLPGTILKPLIYSNEGSNAELYIGLISGFFLFSFYICLIYISIRIIKKNDFSLSSILVIVLFLSSPYIVMSAHLIGYTDNILIMLSIICIWLVIRQKIWAASILIFVSVFIHEIILLTGLPAVVCAAYLQYINDNKLSEKKTGLFLVRYLPLFILPLAAFSLIILNQIFFVNEELEKKFVSHLTQFSFIKENRNHLVPEELTKSFLVYLDAQSPKFFRRIFSPFNIVRNVLPLSVILLFIWSHIKSYNKPKPLLIIILAAVFLPLSLHLVAWDTARIWTFPLMISFLILFGIAETLSTIKIKVEGSLLLIVFSIIIIIFNIFIHTPLMDNEYERLSNELRILLYFPPVSLILYLILKNYKLKKET